VFCTEKAVIKLMHSLPVEMQIISMDDAPPTTDYYVPILSLPLIFKTTLENIPNEFPYLFAEQDKCLYWKSRIDKIGGNKLRVGLVWSGAPRPEKLNYRGLNSRRDIPLKLLDPMLKEDVQFFSLQVGTHAKSQLNNLESSLKESIIDWTNDLKDFADTAALINNLDVVVCVDTSTAHLTAALGKPVLLLNRKDTCWRWLESGDCSPWYPNIKILRQPELLQWDTVIQLASAELRKLSSTKMSS